MNIFPISFSINKSKIIDKVPNKTKLLAHIIPGDLSTYIYTNEENYYNDYRESYFAITKCKGGWDCLRHYEILANGCIPYFIDIENIPKNTMTFFPKDLIIETNKIYHILNNNPNINDEKKYKKICNIYTEFLLNYTKKNLTNTAIANYILRTAHCDNVKNILFLSGYILPDYLRCLTLVGFKEIFGTNCHDYPIIPHIYKDYKQSELLYGKGITYSKLLDRNIHDDKKDETILDDIRDQKYDIIIYGSLHRGTPFLSDVKKYYSPEKIIFLCGEDFHNCNYNLIDKNSYVFVRELN
jgi:hypothetical protein